MYGGQKALAPSADWRALWFDADAAARLIVTPHLAVLHANAAAQSLLLNVPEWSLSGTLEPPPALAGRLRTQIRGAGADTVMVLPPLAIRLQRLSAGAVGLTLRDLRAAIGLVSPNLEPVFGLTRAEQQTLLLLLSGMSAQELAARLNKSVLTVRTHVKHLHVKLGVKSKEQLFARILPYLFTS